MVQCGQALRPHQKENLLSHNSSGSQISGRAVTLSVTCCPTPLKTSQKCQLKLIQRADAKQKLIQRADAKQKGGADGQKKVRSNGCHWKLCRNLHVRCASKCGIWTTTLCYNCSTSPHCQFVVNISNLLLCTIF